MTRDEMQQLVRDRGLGHLCLADGGNAYGVPLFYAFDGEAFYFHSHPGLKDSFIDATSEACLLVTRADAPDAWQSVQAFGRVERVADRAVALKAADALMRIPFPPVLGTDAAGRPMRSQRQTTVWRLVPARWAGRKSAVASAPATMDVE